jgi:ribosomal protein S18 acetylase RimI-like enzyme
MPLQLSTITSADALAAMREPWSELAAAGGPGALFRSPEWLLPWWHAYREALSAELMVQVGHDGDRLVCLAPLYARTATVGPAKIREIRLIGDAGPRPPALDVLVAPGFEEAAAAALADFFQRPEPAWDVIDLQPLQDPSRLRAFLVQRLDTNGKRVESSETGGARRIALSLAGLDLDEVLPADPNARAYTGGEAARKQGLAALRRLSRLEWSDREEASPIAEPEATRLLEQVAAALGESGRARLSRLDEDSGEATAAAFVVDDGDRAVVLAMAVDPEHIERGAGTRLLVAEARAASERGRRALDVVIGASEYAPPSLPTSRQRALRLQVFNTSTAASVARTYGAVRRGIDTAREAPGAAAAGARAAWSKIRTAAANVAAYGRLQLYRGELWIRGIEPTPGLTLAPFSEADLDALPETERALLVQLLELDEAYCREKWRRGDLVVLARIDGRAAGISWCARTAVHVPELGREVRPGHAECYIHDVFVAPFARGRSVAPSMLEFLAAQLRQLDVYRSWALIGPNNAASIRAFEKAAYTAVADVVYARMATVGRVTVRPPDPEAKELLGLN